VYRARLYKVIALRLIKNLQLQYYLLFIITSSGETCPHAKQGVTTSGRPANY
jgi:hypothetical protein